MAAVYCDGWSMKRTGAKGARLRLAGGKRSESWRRPLTCCPALSKLVGCPAGPATHLVRRTPPVNL
jgi:hypothetical protein